MQEKFYNVPFLASFSFVWLFSNTLIVKNVDFVVIRIQIIGVRMLSTWTAPPTLRRNSCCRSLELTGSTKSEFEYESDIIRLSMWRR